MNWDPSCMNRALKDTSPTELEVQHLQTYWWTHQDNL
jgi:hypothetical protein